MSQLIISRLLKPSISRNVLRRANVRLFSSTSASDSDDDETTGNGLFYSRTPYPFLFIDHILNNPDSPDGRVKKYYDDVDKLGRSTGIIINDKTLAEEVCNAMTAGFSRDGLQFWRYGDNGFSISYKPSNRKLKDMTVYLPDLPTGSKIQSLAMSSLPNREKDWVVGVTLSGSRLSICRPFGSCKWIDFKSRNPCMDPLSSLMFSKRYKSFYIPSPGGNFLCFLQKPFEELDYCDLVFGDLPNSVLQDSAKVSSCSRSDHPVESPTGDIFLVKWYSEDVERYENNESNMSTLTRETKKFMVFRQEETDSCYMYEKTMIYTEDIGDLCIFLGHSEAYCVPASSSPGLRPNCIYFVGRNFGVYDLTTKTCTTFYTDLPAYSTFPKHPLRKTEFPYWPSQVTP
ncbi:unnamed protein product [Microthlaspi erraticum]|uniref:KIB1-4 beta-propeller domain-containing protein n=1 Tax=Microthlaspi erraticum TaxID=1685480 RepID=A0A6D2KTY4_9BRAS|nr:unnamed protein product [Microthlaspi erraticum]